MKHRLICGVVVSAFVKNPGKRCPHRNDYSIATLTEASSGNSGNSLLSELQKLICWPVYESILELGGTIYMASRGGLK